MSLLTLVSLFSFKKWKHKDVGKPYIHPAVCDVPPADSLPKSYTKLNDEKYKSSRIHLEDDTSENFEKPLALPSWVSKHQVKSYKKTETSEGLIIYYFNPCYYFTLCEWAKHGSSYQ